MRTDVSYPNKVYIFVVLVFILILASLVNTTITLKRSRKDFSYEMAQRLDFEEKAIKFEKVRDTLAAETKALKAEVLKNKQEIKRLKEEKASLLLELQKAGVPENK